MLWLKALHLMSMVTWFAGIFYLPRLFVYHSMADDETGIERFKVMERKLYRGITTPSMIATLVLGILLIATNATHYLQQGWLHAKLVLVLVLVGYHFWCGHFVRLFREGRNPHSHVFYRLFNEFPVLLLVAIIILAVLRPF